MCILHSILAATSWMRSTTNNVKAAPREVPASPNPIPANASVFPWSWPPLRRMSRKPSSPNTIAGNPVKNMRRSDDRPSLKLRSARVLVVLLDSP
jgi:hypothetical protein